MIKIALTLPQCFEGEERALAKLVSEGYIVHIRKPESSVEEIDDLLGRLRALIDMKQVTLHYQNQLALKWQVGGVHCRQGQHVDGFRNSCSCHSWSEVLLCEGYDYVFLSPVFDSISKVGYKAAFDIETFSNVLHKKVLGTKVIALGGVCAENVDQVESMGFDGYAMLGAIWNVDFFNISDGGQMKIGESDSVRTGCGESDSVRTRFGKSDKKVQYITRGGSMEAVLAECKAFLDGGGRWIQLRMKGAEWELIVAVGRALKTLCTEYEAMLIINDNPKLVSEIGADGVHVGSSDMPVSQAREVIGDGIVGATANTFEDVARLVAEGADYIGLGPYRFTTTKKNLSPVLGVEGYRGIMERCREIGINVPIVAIGGVEVEDVASILATGVCGIAVSGAIGAQVDPKTATQRFVEAVS